LLQSARRTIGFKLWPAPAMFELMLRAETLAKGGEAVSRIWTRLWRPDRVIGAQSLLYCYGGEDEYRALWPTNKPTPPRIVFFWDHTLSTFMGAIPEVFSATAICLAHLKLEDAEGLISEGLAVGVQLDPATDEDLEALGLVSFAATVDRETPRRRASDGVAAPLGNHSRMRREGDAHALNEQRWVSKYRAGQRRIRRGGHDDSSTGPVELSRRQLTKDARRGLAQLERALEPVL
jgi:hypothetical protein